MESLLHSLQARLALCSEDELAAFDALLAKLEAGRAVYGPLVLAADGRDWHAERRAELVDALWYGAFGEIAEGRR